MITMMAIGRYIGRLDARVFLCAGFALTSLSLYWMTGFSLGVDERDIVLSGILQGVGLGLIWVPMTAVAFSTLKPERRTEAAGIFSLMRNIGASAGIAIVAALLDRSTQINHAELAASITRDNPLFRLPFYQHLWDLHAPAGLAALNAELTRQAAMIGYLNDYRLLMILGLVGLPLVFLISGPKRSAAPEEAAAVMD